MRARLGLVGSVGGEQLGLLSAGLLNTMRMFPTSRQWRNWKLPSKLTAIGAYAGLAGLLVALAVLAVDIFREAAGEELVLESVRVNDDYQTAYLRPYSYRAAVSEPAFVQALWDVTVVNNGRRAVSLVDCEVGPVIYAPGRLEGGILDATTGETIQLPITIAAGHAVLIRVRGYLMVPGAVAFKLAQRYGQVEKEQTMGDLTALLVDLRIDLFGNMLIIGGPDSPYISRDESLLDGHVRVVFRTGRGASVGAELWWYGPDVEPRLWGRRQRRSASP